MSEPTLMDFLARLEQAEDRLFDLLLGDDGQAVKEAERYLARHRPDLMQRLEVNK